MDRGEDRPPLGAQARHRSDEGESENDEEERSHFRRVCDSYRQYATFHITRELGVHRRRRRLLSSSRRVDDEKDDEDDSDAPFHAIESILPPSLRPDSPEYRASRARLRDAAIRNQYFLDCALRHSDQETSQDALRRRRQITSRGDSNAVEWVTEDQMSKVDSVLRSVARDWSAEGREERGVAYDRIAGAVERYAPLPAVGGAAARTTRIRIAVPGSGLGRLAWELRSRGYSVEGSDFSLPMLLASDFVLNGRCSGSGSGGGGGDSSSPKFAISPWIAETKNSLSLEDRVRTVIVPDVDTADAVLPPSRREGGGGDSADDRGDDDDDCPEFTMLAGEFMHLYSHFLPGRRHRHRHDEDDPDRRRKFHVVACSYFLDTAPSLPHYLLTMYHMLEYGGLLVHFGPLMFHWSGHGGLLPNDVETDGGDDDRENNGSWYDRRNERLDSRYLSSIDYTWEEVREMIVGCGFVIVEEETRIPNWYASDARSMMKVVYDCVFCLSRSKPPVVVTSDDAMEARWWSLDQVKRAEFYALRQ
ncbi:hypothetical protein ACHAW5_008870 [Stephanodiscus triporus]|uniref:carnosine N-methyltransferase n=1 Tax=Stephanodiscus triporus TaxID=2934178 RepID=A0ABD3NQW1_9STRA